MRYLQKIFVKGLYEDEDQMNCSRHTWLWQLLGISFGVKLYMESKDEYSRNTIVVHGGSDRHLEYKCFL